MPKSRKERKQKKGGFELAPIAAAGILLAAASSKKKSRKVRGGAEVVSPAVEKVDGVKALDMIAGDVRRESPAAAAVAGSAANSPLVTGNISVGKGEYVGATAESRPASVSAQGGLLEGGGKKKRRSRKVKGGDCHPVNSQIMSTGDDIRASPVVAGAVGGVENQSEPQLVGGAKRRRKSRKQRGGEDMPSEGGEVPAVAQVSSEGGDVSPLSSEGGEDSPVSQEGGKMKKRRAKKRGGNDGGDVVPVPLSPPAQGGVSTTPVSGGVDSAEEAVAAYKGGAKKRRSKKRGGAAVEAFDAGAETHADALGGFDKLLVDLKQQVGGKGKKGKKAGGAFKLYARELTSLSKKLKKLM